MYGPKKILEVTVFFTLLGIKWVHHQFVVPAVQLWMDTVLGTGEEVLKAWIRESFTNTTRYVNGFFAYIVALFVDQNYYKSFRSSWRRTQAWQAWWQEDRESTLNAFIATHSDSQRKHSHANPGRKRLPNSPRERRQKRRWYSEWWHRFQIGIGRWIYALSSFLGYGTDQYGPPGSPRRMHRNGSDLFDRPSGWAVDESSKRRGLLEDIRMNCELAVSAVFDWLRKSLRWVTRMPQKGIPEGRPKRIIHSHVLPERTEDWEEMMAKPRKARFRRRNSFSSWDSSYKVWTAADVIRQAGYPLEEHTVTTSDGYVLQMERIPRAGCEDVVFFMHGILDTSMGWVSNGVTGSQAFAAYDMGMDVWLGNSRSNPPRVHVDPRKNQTAKYWTYSVNELGMEDCAAQIDHIHVVKVAERSADALGLASGPLAMHGEGKHVGALKGMRRSLSASAVDELLQHNEESAAAVHKKAPRASQDEVRSPRLRAQSAAPEAPGAAYSQPQAGTRSDSAEMQPVSASLAMRGPLADAANRPATLKHAHSSRSRQGHAAFGHRDGLTEQEDWVPRMPIANGNASLVAGIQLNSHAVDVPPSDQLIEEDFLDPSPSPRTASPVSGSDMDRFEDASSIPGSPPSNLPESPTFESPDRASISSHSNSLPAESWMQPGSKRSFLQRSSASLTPDRSSRAATRTRAQVEAPTAVVGLSEEDAGGPKKRESGTSEKSSLEDPYRLRAVGHSLGGAALLIYVIMSLRKKRPHHIHRLVLLTPAGYMQKVPLIAWPPRAILPVINKLITWRWPNSGAAVIIPSSLLRFITFKLTVDLQKVPALQELTRAAIRLLMSGDASEWDRAMQMPHYNTRSMPAISMHTGMHLIQWIHTGRFELYDYGSAAANQAHYGCPKPIDIAANYGLLDCPVDILAGRADGIIAKENVLKHFEEMSRHRRSRNNVKITYKEFDFGHLDFTFAFKEDLVYYVKSRLKLQ